MTFIDSATAHALSQKMSADEKYLKKLLRAKSAKYHTKSVSHGLVDSLVAEGWEEFGKPLKTKTKLRKLKRHDEQFEDDIWCQLYRLGYRNLNIDAEFRLPFGKDDKQRKQIDVIAIDDESIILVECKSSAQPQKAPSFKTEFEALKQRLDGYSKSLSQIFGPGRKIKYIFAVRNLRISRESTDVKRLEESNSFFYNDNTFEYIESLIKNYKDAAHYQFMGLLFKGTTISKDRIEVPAIEGRMGAKTYYMFSIEPHLLLKLGFVLHRTRANETEMPTYQRLLVPSRLRGITKFIDNGGYFPNSAIINFSNVGSKIEFQGQARGADTNSRTGLLKIPNAYAVAYIIDGQHRIYGYANSQFKASNTIPVVAFKGLSPAEQLELFMDINQNQKAVSATLRITLEEDLYWDSSRLDSRLKALRSSIIRQLGGDPSSPLFGKISLGEDRARLQAKPFVNALQKSGLIPEAKGNKFLDDTTLACLYDCSNTDHSEAMASARSKVVEFIGLCYEFAEESCKKDRKAFDTFILSNRGTYAFIMLLGSLNKFETETGELTVKSSGEDRAESMQKYLQTLLKALGQFDEDQTLALTVLRGSGADLTWFRTFQDIVSNRFPSFLPADLVDWRERQDKELQERGRVLGTAIERHLKKVILAQLKTLFGTNWDVEIGKIQRECAGRASKEIEAAYKKGLGRKEIPWTDMFLIQDYIDIIEKYWSKVPEGAPKEFENFEKIFALDIGKGFNSKAEKLRWLEILNSYRNSWAHEGSKEKGLNRQEVEFIELVHKKLGLSESD